MIDKLHNPLTRKYWYNPDYLINDNDQFLN
jgi:hypothetical protein